MLRTLELIMSLSNDDDKGRENVTLFCTFLSRHYKTTTWKCLISRFSEDMNTRQRLSLSYLELRYSLLESYSRKLHQHLKIWKICNKRLKQHDFVLFGVAVFFSCLSYLCTVTPHLAFLKYVEQDNQSVIAKVVCVFIRWHGLKVTQQAPEKWLLGFLISVTNSLTPTVNIPRYTCKNNKHT